MGLRRRKADIEVAEAVEAVAEAEAEEMLEAVEAETARIVKRNKGFKPFREPRNWHIEKLTVDDEGYGSWSTLLREFETQADADEFIATRANPERFRAVYHD